MLLFAIFLLNEINNKVYATDSNVCEHIDNGDIYDGRCDLCNEFVGSDLVLGENSIVQTNTYTYKRFIPDESCNYWF